MLSSPSIVVECEHLHPFELEFNQDPKTNHGTISLFFLDLPNAQETKKAIVGCCNAYKRMASADYGIEHNFQFNFSVEANKVEITTNEIADVWHFLKTILDKRVVAAVQSNDELMASNLLALSEKKLKKRPKEAGEDSDPPATRESKTGPPPSP